MFLDYYGLREQPFGVTPNPRFLFLSPSHREVLASLLYAIQSDLGFSALIAEPGMGKTTLLFDLLERYRNSANTAFLFQTQCNSQDLLRYLLAEFGVETEGRDSFFMHEKFRDVLLQSARENKKVLVILDEAHNLDDSVLETIRLLSNFETSDTKLAHIILAGQPHLAEKLMRPTMAQLFQRIAIVNRLKPFTFEETCAYIDHRLEVAGYNQAPLFTRAALEEIARYSYGMPRTINRLCFGGMSIACALNMREIDASIIAEVRDDLNLSSLLTSDSDYEVPLRFKNKLAVEPDPSYSKAIPSPASCVEPQPVPSSPTGPQRARADETYVEQPPPAPLVPTPSDASLDNLRNIVSPQRPQGKAALRAQKKAAARSPSRIAATAFMIASLLLLLGALLVHRVPELDKIFAKSPDTKIAEDISPAIDTPQVSEDKPAPAQPVKARKSQKSRSQAALGVAQSAVSNAGRSGVTLPSFANANSPVMVVPTPTVDTARDAAKQNPPEPTQLEEPAPPPVNVATSGRSSQPLASVMENVSSATPKVEPDTPPASASAAAATIVPGKLVDHPQPVYPEEAKRLGIEGAVRLRAVITKDGKLKNVRATEGETRLASAAEAAVRKWKYTPYMLNGEPIEVDTEIRVNFNLNSR
jgi:general secretion pathway protein A